MLTLVTLQKVNRLFVNKSLHTVYIIQHTVYSIQYAAYSIQYIVYSIQYTAYSNNDCFIASRHHLTTRCNCAGEAVISEATVAILSQDWLALDLAVVHRPITSLTNGSVYFGLIRYPQQ